jgi:chromate transporter
VLPELRRRSVAVHAWLTDGQFAAVYAISQGAPGPAPALAGLIGLGRDVGRVARARLPVRGRRSCIWRASPWALSRLSGVAPSAGLAPVSMGLLFAAGVIIVRAADHGWTGFVVTAVTTAVLVVTKVNPLLVMAGAGLLGWLGLVH